MRVNDKIDARFLERNRIAWRNVMSNVEGAVTAIYYDTGWGRYIGNSELATRDGVQLGPAPTRAVIIAAGWQYKVNNAGHVQWSETDPTEWIVDIEDRMLKKGT